MLYNDEAKSMSSIVNLLNLSKLNYTKRNPYRSKFSLQGLICIFIGVFIGFTLATWLRAKLLNCSFMHGTCCLTGLNEHLLNENVNSIEYSAKSSLNLNNGLFKNIDPTKNLVFIGVMTAQKYLDTRAKAVYDTWGSNIPGKMSFFSRAGSSSQFDIPLVSLPGVDDSYPPQKKSFMMLKYMHDNYLDKFEWFMRVDDDVYIKPEKLETFLRSINSSKPQFIGQAGMGNKDEFGLLSLDSDENFCMGGPGIAMSRETLRLVVPNISQCLKNLYSTHEDVEIGRCIRRFAGIPCTWSYEMQHIFHHNSSGNEAYTKELLSKDVLRAVSLHPVKQPQYHYRLQNFFSLRKIMKLRQKRLLLHREIYNMKETLSHTSTNTSEAESVIQSNNTLRFKQNPLFTIIKTPEKRTHRKDFEYFTRSLFSSSYISPRRGLESYLKRSIGDAMRQIMDEINKNSIQRGRVIDFKEILYGYLRFNPLMGMDYVIDSLLMYRKYEGRKMTVPVRRHAYVRQIFTDILFREDNEFLSKYYRGEPSDESLLYQQSYNFNNNLTLMKRFFRFIFPSSDENVSGLQENGVLEPRLLDDLGYLPTNENIAKKVINFIVPLAGRLEVFKRFIGNFETICLKTNELVKLAIVLFTNEKSDEDLRVSVEVKKIIENLKTKYSNQYLHLIEVKTNFSRSIACEMGASVFSTTNSLLFFVDVDMMFTREFLMRIRLNTIENKQVYFPIVFSEYDPNPGLLRGNTTDLAGHNRFDFSKDSGYWRLFGFGIVSAYASDLKRIGGFDTSILGWGKEDVDLYEKFVRSNITVFRSVDPGLVHVFHKIKCDPNLQTEQLVMCMGTKSTSIASQKVLATFMRDHNLYGVMNSTIN